MNLWHQHSDAGDTEGQGDAVPNFQTLLESIPVPAGSPSLFRWNKHESKHKNIQNRLNLPISVFPREVHGHIRIGGWRKRWSVEVWQQRKEGIGPLS